jgi:hypothetical protein
VAVFFLGFAGEPCPCPPCRSRHRAQEASRDKRLANKRRRLSKSPNKFIHDVNRFQRCRTAADVPRQSHPAQNPLTKQAIANDPGSHHEPTTSTANHEART